mgnify:CR=1 FL=1
MSLSSLIRKRSSGKAATAIPAIPATDEGGTASKVAGIATIAVASTTNEKTEPANDPSPLGGGSSAADRERPPLVSQEDLHQIMRHLLTHLATCRDCVAESHLYCSQASRTGNGYAAYLTEFPDAEQRHADYVAVVIQARIRGLQAGFTALEALTRQDRDTGRETARGASYGIDKRPAELAFVNHFTACAYCFPRSGKYCGEGRELHELARLEALQ